MKRDGRLLDHRTLEAIRLMAVERVKDGERPSSVVTSYGFNRTTIYRWLAAARPGVGLRALHAKPATGRPRSLTSHQEKRVFRWINGHDPRQYGLDFGLWTRSLVAELIERKFAIRLGVTAVGELLAKLGLTPQRPLQRPMRLRRGSANGILPLPDRRRLRGVRYISGMSRGFVPMACMARPGARRARHLLSNALASGNRSVRPRR